MAELMGDGARVLALAHRGQAPLLRAGQPARPLDVARRDPARLVRVGIAPLRRDVVLGVELHLAELLPDAGLVVARVEAQDGVEALADVLADRGRPDGVAIPLHAAFGLDAVGRVAVLAVFVEAVVPDGLGHVVGAEDLDLGDAETAPRLLHPVAVDGLAVVVRVRLHPEVGVELRDLVARDGVDLRVAEGVRALRQGDDERLAREIDADDGQLEAALRLDRRVGPVDAGDGAVVGPGHRVLVLDALGVDGAGDGAAEPQGRRFGACGAAAASRAMRARTRDAPATPTAASVRKCCRLVMGLSFRITVI